MNQIEMHGPDREEIAFLAGILLDALNEDYMIVCRMDEEELCYGATLDRLCMEMSHCDKAIALFEPI